MDKIDFIGDIHGYANHLEKLLLKLGYSNSKGWYQHPKRKVIFVGDYIDRGPKIRETLQIVKAMADNGSAIALMGNHEYNAICFNELNQDGGYLREHSIKNFKQHAETLFQFQNRQEEYNDYIDWFKSLPLFIETDLFRAVHATWSDKEIDILTKSFPEKRLTHLDFVSKKNKIDDAIELSLKGKELKLPKGEYFFDKDGHKREEIRIKWWLKRKNKTYEELSIVSGLKFGDLKYLVEDDEHYSVAEKPVFFGHYWLKGQPNLYRGNICCLDYSVAKNGYLACYRFNGERELSNENFVFV